MSGSEFSDHFPDLNSKNYRITSEATKRYNCIAWAADCDTMWWWPTKFYFWPENVAREETGSAFLAAFETLGYEKCENGLLEAGYEKVALFADPNTYLPTHAARQLSDGRWTSKLGEEKGIEHEKAEDVSGPSYGNVVQFMRRAKAEKIHQAIKSL